MKDDELTDLLHDAARTYRVPAEPPPLDEMWREVEAAHFSGGRSPWRSPRRRFFRHSPSWRLLAIGLAATLVFGIGIGRYSARVQDSLVDAVRGSEATETLAARSDAAHLAAGPYQEATTRYLGQTAALLIALPSSPRDANADRRFILQAGELLSTTRLLLDSPAANDPQLKSLLDDLELVLAQIARLPAKRDAAELDLIHEALEQRDVVPRLRSVVADMPITDN